MHLSKEIIAESSYDGRSYRGKSGKLSWSRCTLWDESEPALGLRISPVGRKTFVVRFRQGKKARERTIGTVAEWTLDDARTVAGKISDGTLSVEEARRRTPSKVPRDPVGDAPREPSRQVESAEPAFERIKDLATAYAKHLKSERGLQWQRSLLLLQRRLVPRIGRHPMALTGPKEIATLRTRVMSGAGADSRGLEQLLTGMFEWAAQYGGTERAEATRPEPAPNAESPRDVSERERARSVAAEPAQASAESEAVAFVASVADAELRSSPDEVRSTTTSTTASAPTCTSTTTVTATDPVAMREAEPDPDLDSAPWPSELSNAHLRHASPMLPDVHLERLTSERLEVLTAHPYRLRTDHRFVLAFPAQTFYLSAVVESCRLIRNERGSRGELRPVYRARFVLQQIEEESAA